MSANYRLSCGCTLSDEMVAHDALPDNLRTALVGSPLGYCAKALTNDIAAFGIEEVLRQFRIQERHHFRNTDQSVRV